MPSASIAYQIRDAVKDALAAEAFITSRSATVETMPLPKFDVVQAGESTLLKVAAFESAGIKSHDRSGVAKLYNIGIGVYRKLVFDATGEIDESRMDDMIHLVEQIEQWGWNGVSGYACLMSKTVTDALFDGPKAKAAPNVFFNVINLQMVADYDK